VKTKQKCKEILQFTKLILAEKPSFCRIRKLHAVSWLVGKMEQNPRNGSLLLQLQILRNGEGRGSVTMGEAEISKEISARGTPTNIT